jgi:thiol-disulfide isomerase/thioredoxin
LLKLPNIDAEETLLLFKAQVADAAHDDKAAYDSITHYYIKKPNDTLQKAMLQYASKLGFSPKFVQIEIKRLRDSSAKQATDFSLLNYVTKQNVSLSDFKGKVILLTYWFPGCGLCRMEMPYFEKVLKKFDKKDVAYIAINAISSQDKFVMPILKSTGYSFVPLRDPLSGKGGNLQAQAYPTNFLINQTGRIVFSNFWIDGNNQDMLELMISELLDGYKKADCLADTTKVN